MNTKVLPNLGYIAASPALQIPVLRSVKRITKQISKSVESADGKVRTEPINVPAIEIVLNRKDAGAMEALFEKSIGQRLYIEAAGTPIYAPLVRKAQSASVLIFSVGDDQQLDAAYRALERFVKK